MAKQRIIEAVLKFKDEFSSVMSGAMQKMDANSRLFKKTGQEVWKTGKKIKSVGSTLTKTVTTPIVGLGTASSKMYMDFESSMAKVQTIADASGISMKGMEDDILSLSNKTGIASSDIANNVYDAISAGQTTAKGALEATETAVNLSKAGFTDTASAMDVLTTITNSYGKEAGSMADISDTLISIQNKGKVTVDQLASTMGGVIPIAKSNSVSLNDLGASYISLTKNGVDSAKSTTWMKSMYNELGKSTTTVAKTLKTETGKSFSELTAEGKSVGDVLQILKDSAEKTGTNFNDMWSNVNAKSGANALLNNINDYNSGLKDLQSSAGTTETALGALGKTDQSKLNKAINRLKNDMIKLGSTVLPLVMPYLEKGMKIVQGLADKFNSLDKKTKNNIVKFAALAAAAGPVLSVIGSLTMGVGNFIGNIPKLVGKLGSVINTVRKVGGAIKSVFTVLAANPVAAIILGIVVAITALTVYFKTHPKQWKAVCEKAKSIINSLKTFVKNAVEKIKEVFGKIKEKVGTVISAVKDKFGQFKNALGTAKDKVVGFASSAKDKFNTVKQNAANMAANIKTSIKGKMQTALMSLTRSAAGGNPIAQGLLTMVAGAKKVLHGLITFVKGVFTGNWKKAFSGIKQVIGGFGLFFKGKIKTALGVVKAFVKTELNGIKNIFKKIFNLLPDPAKKALTKIGSTIKSKLTAAKNTITSILTAVKTKFQSIFDKVKSIVTGAIDKVKSAFNFSWKLPELKMPHISVTGGKAPFGIGGKGSLPKFNIEWYKKAYNQPYVLKNPTIFGQGSNGQYLGGGEGNGSEVIIGLTKLRTIMQQAAVGAGQKTGSGQSINITIPKLADQVVIREEADADRLAARFAHQLEIHLADYATA